MGVRDTAAWRRARTRALRGATHCAECGRELDFAAPPRSRWAPSVDHVRPLALGGEPFAQANLRVLHVGCNARLGGRLGARLRRRVVAPGVRRADWW